jgi:cytochrome b
VENKLNNLKVWDLPIRVFHWLLVLSIIGLFVTGKIGGNWMEWHTKLGFFTLGLIAFRIVWGFVGGFHARFINFVRGPGTVWRYFMSVLGKSAHESHLGHNPMGALSALALLAAVGFQAVSGLFADDEILLQGPYASMVPSSVSSWFTKMHHLNSNLIIGLVVLHVCAIVFYHFVKKENLVKAMITGEKPASTSPKDDASNALSGAEFQASSHQAARPAWVFWLVSIVIGVLTWAVVTKAVVRWFA